MSQNPLNEDHCGVLDCTREVADILVFANEKIWDLPVCQGHLLQYMRMDGLLNDK